MYNLINHLCSSNIPNSESILERTQLCKWVYVFLTKSKSRNQCKS